MRFIRTLGLLCGLCLSAFNVAGQTDSIPISELDTIIIKKKARVTSDPSYTRSYEPYLTDTLALKRMSSRNLSDVLSRTSGIFVKNYGPGNISAITMRGMSASQTRITWNGLELNSPMYGMADLNLIPVAAFGSASISPSSTAIGGSVNLENERLKFAGLSFSGTQSVESFGGRHTQLSTKYGRNADSVFHGGATKLYYRTAENDFPFQNNARFGSPAENQRHAATELYGILQEYYRTVSNGDYVQGCLWAQHNFRELPAPLTSANNRETQEDNSIRAAMKYRKKAKWGMFYADAGMNNEELVYDNEIIGLHSASRSVALRGTGTAWFTGKKTDYSAALTGTYVEATEGRYFGRKNQSRLQGNFGMHSHKYRLQAIARPELINFKHFLPNFYLGFWRHGLTKAELLFEANIQMNFKYPTLNDLYWDPGGNDSLKPEKAFKQEISLSRFFLRFLHDGESDLGLTAYSIYAYDFIQWQPADGAYWQAQNLREVWSRGIEASAKFRKPMLRGLMLWNNSYNYTRASTQKPISPGDKSVGRQLIYVPRYMAQSSLQYEHKKFFAGAYYTYTDYRRTPDGYLPPYQLIDLDMGLEKKFREIEAGISFRVNNILNESYQVIVWRPMPGRWYSVTLNITWAKKKEKR